MGLLRDWMKSRNMKDPVRGALYVTSNTVPPMGAVSGNFTINGIVSATGLVPTAIEHQGVARVKKWPRTGQTLPVTVDRADPTRVRVEWDELPDSGDVAAQRAQQVAESMRQPGPTGGAAPTAGPTEGVTVTYSSDNIMFQHTEPTTIDASGIPGLREEILKIASDYAHDPAKMQELIHAKLIEFGVLNPDGSAGPAGHPVVPGTTFGAAGPAQPSSGQQDPAIRLRKLQELRRDGLVTDEEYTRLRAQILTEL